MNYTKYLSKIVLTSLLLAIFSCKEKSEPIKLKGITFSYTDPIPINIMGTWQLDTIWQFENDRRINPSLSILNTFWIFEDENNWHLESENINTQLDGIEVELGNPANTIKSQYTITDSILTIKLYNLKYKILEVDSDVMYLKSIDLPYISIQKLKFTDNNKK